MTTDSSFAIDYFRIFSLFVLACVHPFLASVIQIILIVRPGTDVYTGYFVFTLH